ncbi:MAG TPA: hypothetical protein VGR55_19075 [Candidatus Acidoferrum sp.]|nr:hypothetical protein [Candidatus Acidoferrum sp.]
MSLRKAWRNCSWVFMTMGPYQATGSSSGLPGNVDIVEVHGERLL